jgi:hypothetical protein
LINGKPDFFSRAQKTALGLAQDRPDYLYFRLYKEPGSPAVQIKVVLHQDPDSVSSTGCPVDPVVGCLFGLLKVVSSG